MTSETISIDLEFASAVYNGVSDPALRAVLDYLIEHPDQEIEGPRIAAAINAESNRVVARATFAYGEIARDLGRGRPWHEAQGGYTMPAEAAALFRKVRQNYGTYRS